MESNSSKTGLDSETWDKLTAPFPPEAYKDVPGGFKMTTICAYHIVERLTEVFGLCGTGWGFQDLEFSRDGPNVACVGVLWYNGYDTEPYRYKVHAVGDAMVRKNNIAEAYKKAQTNLMSKASSFIGVGLAVYKGIHADEPYHERNQQPVQAPALTYPPLATAQPQQPLAPVVEQVQQQFQGTPVCPMCNSNAAVIRSKPEFGGGWLCYRAKGGCGNTWK